MIKELLAVDENGFDRWKKMRKRYQSRKTEFGRMLVNQRWKRFMLRFGAWIPLTASIDDTVQFPHGLRGVFISTGAIIEKNCVIFQQVTIGSNTLQGSKNFGAPHLEKNVYVGAGAKIIGKVTVGENARIGANCVVVKDIPKKATAVCQAARIIQHTEERTNQFIGWDKQ